MKLNLLLLSSSVSVIAALTACKPTYQVTVNSAGVIKTETVSQTDGAIHKLIPGNWTATNINGVTVDGTDRPYIEFGENTADPFLVKCYAYDGCNFINGEYTVTPDGEIKRTSQFISTMRMCPEAKYEPGMKQALNNVTGYRIEKSESGYLLYFNDAHGQALMILRKFETGFINGAWRVTSINGSSVDDSTDITLVIDLDQLSIHGNAGCNTLNGTIAIDPDQHNSIAFPRMITTRMTCPAIATEQALLEALSTVTNVMPNGSDDAASFRNSAGNTVITLERVSLK